MPFSPMVPVIVWPLTAEDQVSPAEPMTLLGVVQPVPVIKRFLSSTVVVAISSTITGAIQPAGISNVTCAPFAMAATAV